MKFFKLFTVFSIMLFYGCNKDSGAITDSNELPSEYINSVSNYYTNWESDLESTDGVLKFKSWEHYTTTFEELLLMSYEETQRFENKLNFLSQRTLLEEIMMAEEKLTDEFYAPYAHLSEKEVYDLNLTEPKSEIYNKALSDKLLVVEEDSRDAHTYSLSVVDGTSARLINIEGFVMVGDTLWQYTDSQIKYCTTCTISDRSVLNKALITNDDQTIVTYTIKSMERDNLNWDGNLNKGWEPVANNRRARYERHGYSSTSDNCSNCFMVVKYYLHNEAQRRQWFKWKYRSSYKPWFRWDGTWGGQGNFWYCTNDSGAPPSYQNFTIPMSAFSVSTGVTNQPMVNRRYFGNNNTDVKLHPHSDGSWPAPPNSYPPYNANKCWGSTLNVYSIAIDGKLVQSYSNPVTIWDLVDN